MAVGHGKIENVNNNLQISDVILFAYKKITYFYLLVCV